MKIRLAIPEDVQGILPLFKVLDEKHYRNSKDIRSEIKPERYTFLFDNTFKENSNLILSVAEENSMVIGFALAKMTRMENNFILKDFCIGEVLYVAVEEQHKRNGLGKKLMIDMEHRLKEKGVNKFELRVFSFNDETFPEKINYKPKYTVYEKYL